VIDNEVDLRLDDAETVGVIDAHKGVPVDQPDVPIATTWADITSGDAPRRPIIPAWLRSRDQRRQTLRNIGAALGYWVAFHAVRSPWYLAKTVFYAPKGAGRATGKVLGWATAEQGNWELRQKAAQANDPHVWMQLDKKRSGNAKARWILLGVLCFILAAALSVLLSLDLVPKLGWQAAAVLSVLLLARLGRPMDKPITDRVTQGRRFTKLTGEMVRGALTSLGVPAMKEPGSVEFAHPGIHRDGPGWLARVNLPAGLEAVEILERRGKLSSALRLPVDQVWPSAGPDHAGQLDLWVGYAPASKMGQPAWALASPEARTSFFAPHSFGTDERQRPVFTTLFETNDLVGGAPGSGKTYAARTLAFIALLDPTCELKIAEFKGTGDFLDMADLCSTYVVGVDDTALEAGRDLIAWVLAECERRGKRILAAKKRGEAPLGKVTPELAAKPGSGLHPVFILLDEVHELFGWDKDVAANAERAIKRGRALGIHICLATQIPDKSSLPPNITRCVTVRWCLSVGGQVENDMILGTGAYKRGLTGTVYRPRLDAGWGVTMGLEKPGPVRSFFPDDKTTKAIIARATQLRRGLVVGGVQAEKVKARNMLADARAVFRAGESGLHWETLAERLAETWPEFYAGLTADMVRTSLSRYEDVASSVVNVKGNRLRGVYLTALDAAVSRQEAQIDGPEEVPLPVTSEPFRSSEQ
jgi:DNA segregation ATPase FtsK/SpoIIIE, S-DNA-T family